MNVSSIYNPIDKTNLTNSIKFEINHKFNYNICISFFDMDTFELITIHQKEGRF